ncbi:MAG: ATP-dependent Clp protease ATP-binding subunit [Gemmataceae bacterium]|nr:ATP-dependent Clp protease ATP-binding subunit [Gemmataceae bacterium]
MPTYRYPVLLCRDAARGVSAVAVDANAVGFAATPADARDDLREYLAWFHRRKPWLAGPDVREPRLVWHTVAVRPEYRANDRLYPCETEVAVRVPGVFGTRESGQPTADLPLLGIRFDYTNEKDVPDLVRRYVLQKLEGLAPHDLNRYLPPPEVELVELAVRIPKDDGALAAESVPPTLKQVAEPVGDRAVRKSFARAWGREAEVAALVAKLHREKANVLLVGEGAVGKTTLLVDAVKAAEELAREEDEEKRNRRRYWLTSAGRIVAGMRYLGQWEERVEELIAELGEIGGVLCVERLLELVRRGGFGPADSIAAFLIPYLARGELRMVAEATPPELDACRRLLPGLADLFQIVPVNGFDRGTALVVLDKQLDAAASGRGIEVARGTGERIARLFRRFQPYAPFPGPSSGFARELVEAQSRAGRKTVDPDDAVDRFRRRTGLPELFLRDELTLERAAVLDWFQSRVLDQPDACAAATDVVLTFKAGLNDPGRPPAVLLFCGPTGVGKTHLALAMAEYFFGNSECGIRNAEFKTKTDSGLSFRIPNSEFRTRLIRLDMSEYGGFDAVARLLGPPDGDPGPLVNQVRRQPFSVLLLDEIEKANADVFDTLMGVFDEGRLTDTYGRVTNFRSTIVVMTSNLGAGRGSAVGFGREREGPNYRDAAMKFFRPEFFNRMDAVVTFEPLKPEAVKAIARRELEAIARRDGIARSGIRLVWAESLVERMAQVGFDAKYGARPLQRAIEREVVAALAKWMLDTPHAGRTVEATWTGDAVAFR